MKKGFKLYHVIASFAAGVSVGITPTCFDIANAARGYNAIGGEYLVIPLGLLAAWGIVKIGREIEFFINITAYEDKPLKEWSDEAQRRNKTGSDIVRQSYPEKACRQEYDTEGISASVGN